MFGILKEGRIDEEDLVKAFKEWLKEHEGHRASLTNSNLYFILGDVDNRREHDKV